MSTRDRAGRQFQALSAVAQHHHSCLLRFWKFQESKGGPFPRHRQLMGLPGSKRNLQQNGSRQSKRAQACAHLSRLASDLEAAAHPALDALTRKVTTGTLERVRRIKTRLVRLKTRVETVRPAVFPFRVLSCLSTILL